MAYLKLTSYDDALKTMLERTIPVSETEEVMLSDALDRVVAKDVFSPNDVPAYPKSQMDGYAVLSSDSFDASESAPKPLRIVERLDAGIAPERELGSGLCSYVATGGVVPPGSDSVVMMEDVVVEGDVALISKPVAPGENVMAAGYDVTKGGKIVRCGDVLSPRAIAALSGVGVPTVLAYRRPRVAVISTGNEIIRPGEEYSHAKTYDVNGAFLLAECRRLGCEPSFLGVARDSEAELASMIRGARDHDIVLVSAGVSKGAKDIMETTLSRMGDIIIHGINIKPGKPTLVSDIGSKMLIGLPGHPTSCVVIFSMLVMPVISKLMNANFSIKRERLTVMRRVVATKGRRQFLPVKVEGKCAYPIFRGSGAITSFMGANGIAIIDENVEFVDQGDELEVVLLDD